jgi:hypothetical protein
MNAEHRKTSQRSQTVQGSNRLASVSWHLGTVWRPCCLLRGAAFRAFGPRRERDFKANFVGDR